MHITSLLAKLLFPPECLGCGRTGSYLCINCQNQLRPTHPECYICRRISAGYITHSKCLKQTKANISRLTILWKYEALAKKVISGYKYKSGQVLEDALKKLIIERLAQIKFAPEPNSVLIPIHLHYLRQNSRGFNQAAFICKVISSQYKLPYCENLLLRKRNTSHQARLSATEREINLNDAFEISNKLQPQFINSKFILVDDVVTTGNTIESASELLTSKLNAHQIEALALFRADTRKKRLQKSITL